MGSASLALVVRIYKTVTEKKGRLVVANQDPMVGELLTKAGLEKILEIAPSREEGLRRLGLPTGEMVRRAGGWQNFVAITALLVAAGGGAALFGAMTLPGNTALGMLFSGGSLAFLFALWGIVTAQGSARSVGAILLVVSLGVLMFTSFKLGQASLPAQIEFPVTTSAVPSP
jgi:hypothetical protein